MTAKECFIALLEGIGQILLVSVLFYNSLIPAILFIPYLIFYLKKKDKEADNKHKNQSKTEFKDGIVAVSFALNVGYSVENAFRESVGELKLLYGKDSDIVHQFQLIVKRTRCNENLEDVLSDYAQRSGVEDIRYFAQVFAYGKRSGGDLISMIRNTASTISQKVEVENEIQTIISGKKIEQRVMTAVPFAILCYLRLSAPEFVDPLYGNLLGIIIMTVCLAVYLLSVYLAKRIVNIEV